MTASRFLVGVALLSAGLGAAADGGVHDERCEIARERDFTGEGRRRFERFLESLADASGAPYGIQAKEFELLFSNARAPLAGGDPVGGDIGCSWGKRYILLYKRVLAERTVATTYNTIARQYFHHVQVRRDGVRCDSSVDGVTPLQAEARDWAQKVAPLCP